MKFCMSFRRRGGGGGGVVEDGRRGIVYENFNEIDRSTVMTVINK